MMNQGGEGWEKAGLIRMGAESFLRGEKPPQVDTEWSVLYIGYSEGPLFKRGETFSTTGFRSERVNGKVIGRVKNQTGEIFVFSKPLDIKSLYMRDLVKDHRPVKLENEWRYIYIRKGEQK